ncbi:MAG: thioesterase family protein [Planctomycetaceae bacterium]
MGFLHHANHVAYFEIARTEVFRALGGNYRLMEERGFFLVVVDVTVNYKRPAKYDDLLNVRCRVTRMSGAKLQHEYEIVRQGELLATGRSTLACVTRDGTVQRMSEELLYGLHDG